MKAEGELSRRDVLRTGLVAAGAIALPAPLRALAIEADELDPYIVERMHAGRLPGLSIAVVSDGEQIRSRSFGRANLFRHRPVERGTLFMVASISKTVISTAALQAVEEGLFALDDDVDDHLPFPVRIPEHPGRRVTIRQLLTHTSAIRDRWSVWDDLYVPGNSPIPLGDFLAGYLVPGGEDYRRANFYPFAPGAAYRYSNIGAALAAYVIEFAAGIGFDVWCRERIFGPLRMSRAGWRLADVPAQDVAMPYRWSGTRDRYVAVRQYGYPDYPDGALRATAAHLARHFGMIMRGGAWRGTRVLRRSSVEETLRPQIPDLQHGQGLVWYRGRLGGRRVIGHNGGDKGVATMGFFDPATSIGVIALANGNWRADRGCWPLVQIVDRDFTQAERGRLAWR